MLSQVQSKVQLLFRLRLTRLLVDAARDLAPVVAVIGFFQVLVIGQPLPDLGAVLGGGLLVLVGLALFVKGLEDGLFPLGEAMAGALAARGSLWWLLAFAFCLGFGTTIAEPALIAVTREAARVAAAAGVLADGAAEGEAYALALRLTVAASVGLALMAGVLRILKGWPLPLLIIGGYGAVMGLTIAAPPDIIGIAYDLGGVTTSTVTVPLVTALGVGLASAIRGRNPMTDGFGLIALASLMPMISVLVFGLVR